MGGVAGGSSSVRSTTGSVAVVRALLDGGGSTESGSGPGSPIVVMRGVAEVNKGVGIGEVRGAVLERPRDRLIRNSVKEGNIGAPLETTWVATLSRRAWSLKCSTMGTSDSGRSAVVPAASGVVSAATCEDPPALVAAGYYAALIPSKL